MNAASFITTYAVVMAAASTIICAKAWLVMREEEKRNARLIRQSAEIEAEREANKRTIAALRSLLSHQPLFGRAREFLEIRGGN